MPIIDTSSSSELKVKKPKIATVPLSKFADSLQEDHVPYVGDWIQSKIKSQFGREAGDGVILNLKGVKNVHQSFITNVLLPLKKSYSLIITGENEEIKNVFQELDLYSRFTFSESETMAKETIAELNGNKRGHS